MCGIFLASTGPDSSVPVERALEAIRHRGPDDLGMFVSRDGSCHIGHVRLSIIDLSSAGHQPMADASGRFVISYNGEIYNYPELKEALEKAHGPIAWRSTTDTEVIVEGFARESLAFLSRLNGIFALGIYDSLDDMLYVLRDPLGIKPLFVSEQKGGGFFCSELKGLLALPQLKRTLCEASLGDQLAFMYVPEPRTPYEEFRKLEPGVCVTYRKGSRIGSTALYGHLEQRLSYSSEHEMVEHFYETFRAAVRRQLISDVPVSLMLSGGLDSSAIAQEVVGHEASVPDAYTIGCSDEDRAHDRQSDDTYYARLIAEKLGIELHVIPARRDFLSLLPALVGHLEDGISDPAAINSYLICRAARERGVKVMLTGQGADEFLGGYRRYAAERLVASLPGPVRRLSQALGERLPAGVPGRLNAGMRRLKRLMSLAGQERPQRLLAMYTWSEPELISGLFRRPPTVAPGDDLVRLFEKLGYDDVLDTMMRVDHKYDLMSLNLAYTDRMSMAVGVEARVPFLDLELVRVMNSIPSGMKLKRGVSKYVLKKAMEPRLPSQIVYREKAGFGLPIRAWMRHRSEILDYYFDSGRIRRQDIFDERAASRVCSEHFTGAADRSSLLFSFLCIQIWLDAQDAASASGAAGNRADIARMTTVATAL